MAAVRCLMLGLALCSCFVAACGWGKSPTSSLEPKETPVPPRRSIDDRGAVVRVLDRFAFGPVPGQVERVQVEGLDNWFEAQLLGRSMPVDPRYKSATLAPLGLVESMALKSMVDSGVDESVSVKPTASAPKKRAVRKKVKINFRRLADTLAMAQLHRHVGSEHQLVEVMVDFWSNHFNVFARKGNVKLYAGHYLENAIRPHVLGRFEDLVVATAQHPAMLLYLDNAKSRAPLRGRALEKAERRNAARVAQNKKPKRRRDLNENYARELLELHTVGLKHSQADVMAVARVLTGWGVQPLEDGGGFIFRAKAHDAGTKEVLGQRFGPGQQAGLEMLRFLARHAATARHLGQKLCQRFVSDTPSLACIDSVVRAHQKTVGDIPAMLRAVFSQVRSNAGVTAKIKTPLEFLVSGLRVLDAQPTDLRLARVLEKLGQPTLMMPVPTGYGEAASEWTGSTSMLRRMDVAAALGRGKLKGADIDLDRHFPQNPSQLVARINQQVLHGRATEKTLATMRTQIEGIKRAKQARRIALTLALGSPEFLSQ